MYKHKPSEITSCREYDTQIRIIKTSAGTCKKKTERVKRIGTYQKQRVKKKKKKKIERVKSIRTY